MLSKGVSTAGSLIDIYDFAQRVGLSVPTVRRAIYRGDLQHYRLGKLIRFGERHVDEWLARHEIVAAAPQEDCR